MVVRGDEQVRARVMLCGLFVVIDVFLKDGDDSVGKNMLVPVCASFTSY